MFQLSNGHILVCGDVDTDLSNPANKAGLTWAIEPSYASGGQWTLHNGETGTTSGLWHDSFYDTSVILHELNAVGQPLYDRVLMFGGSRNDGGWEVNNRVWEYSRGIGAAQLGTWHDKSVGTNDFKRLYPGAVILPTGEIFVEGGTSTDEMHTAEPSTPVRTPIIYDPGPSQTDVGTVYPQPIPNVPDWCPTCTQPTARLYHHEAILLRSGKVFVVGGKRPTGGGAGEPDPRFTGEVFSPPYLDLQGMGRTRPVIQSSPSNASFSDNATANAIQISVVRDADKFIDAVVLIRPGANTHHWDNDQRYIELEFLSVTTMLEGGRAVVDIMLASPDEELGPPGYYMLFAIENDGTGLEGHRIPTVGKFIDIQ